MAEDPTQPGITAGDAGQDTQPGTADPPAPSPVADADRKFTESDIQRIVKERLEREKEAARKREERARQEAAEQEAAKNGEHQKLAEERGKRLAELEHELAGERTARLRDRIAARYSLPDALADRLKGSTEEEIEADARALAALLPKAADPPAAPPPAPPGGGAPTNPARPPRPAAPAFDPKNPPRLTAPGLFKR